MSEKTGNIRDLIGTNLQDFSIVDRYEVYRVNEDGHKTAKSLGIFKDADVARAFAEVQADPTFHKVSLTTVLTDNKVAYSVNGGESMHIFNDNDEAIDIRNKLAAKFSPSQRKVLGLS